MNYIWSKYYLNKANVSLSSYCKIQNQYFVRSTVYRKILFRPSGKLTWSLLCVYGLGRTIQLRTESEVVRNFAKPYLLNGLTIADWVINENLVSFSSHGNDSCHGSTVLQSAANEICNKDFFFCICLHLNFILTLLLLLVLGKSLWLLKNWVFLICSGSLMSSLSQMPKSNNY